MKKYIFMIASIIAISCQSEEQAQREKDLKELEAFAKELGFEPTPEEEDGRRAVLDTMSLEEVKRLLLKAKAEVDEHRAQQPEWVSKMDEELRYATTQNEKEQILKKYREEIDAQLESEKR